MQQLSGFDATFLYMEKPRQPLHIGGLFIYDQSDVPGGTLRFKEILAYASDRLHLSAVFRRKVVRVPLDIDHPYWIDDPDFDLEFHIRHIALPEPRDWRQLCIEASRLWARPLDLDRPLWEWWVIEGLDNVEGVPPGSFAVLMKLHHSAVDGKAGLAMIDVAHTRTPDEPAPTAPRSWNPIAPPAATQLIGMAMTNLLTRPFRLAQTLRESMPYVTETLRRGVKNSPMHRGDVPHTRFSGAVTGRRVHDSLRISLDDLRTIRAAVPGATVNDSVVAIVGRAMHHYLTQHGEPPEYSLIAGVPISIRPDSQAAHGGNSVSIAMVSMATDRAEPLKQLAEINKTAKAKKEFTHAVPAHVLTDMAQYVPGTLTMLAARTTIRAVRVGSPCSTIITNVPGWKDALYFAGARLVQYDPMGPVVDTMGIIHPVGSYLGNVVISFDADRDMVPDPEVYRACLAEAFNELLETARAKARVLDSAPQPHESVARKPRTKKPKANRTATSRKPAAVPTPTRRRPGVEPSGSGIGNGSVTGSTIKPPAADGKAAP